MSIKRSIYSLQVGLHCQLNVHYSCLPSVVWNNHCRAQAQAGYTGNICSTGQEPQRSFFGWLWRTLELWQVRTWKAQANVWWKKAWRVSSCRHEHPVWLGWEHLVFLCLKLWACVTPTLARFSVPSSFPVFTMKKLQSLYYMHAWLSSHMHRSESAKRISTLK